MPYRKELSPGLTLVLDESNLIVLECQSPIHTITDVGAFHEALDEAWSAQQEDLAQDEAGRREVVQGLPEPVTGDKLKVLTNGKGPTASGHNFMVGAVVDFVSLDEEEPKSYLATDGVEEWYLRREEFEIAEKNLYPEPISGDLIRIISSGQIAKFFRKTEDDSAYYAESTTEENAGWLLSRNEFEVLPPNGEH